MAYGSMKGSRGGSRSKTSTGSMRAQKARHYGVVSTGRRTGQAKQTPASTHRRSWKSNGLESC